MYYIYHIPGVKVGCTKRWRARCTENKNKHGKSITLELLETVSSPVVADILEYYWNKELGYGKLVTGVRYMTRLKVGNSVKGKVRSKKTRSKMSKAQKAVVKATGKESSRYGTGRWFKELSTGFIGTATEIVSKFNLPNNVYIYNNVRKGSPLVKGKYKGLHFIVVDQPAL